MRIQHDMAITCEPVSNANPMQSAELISRDKPVGAIKAVAAGLARVRNWIAIKNLKNTEKPLKTDKMSLWLNYYNLLSFLSLWSFWSLFEFTENLGIKLKRINYWYE